MILVILFATSYVFTNIKFSSCEKRKIAIDDFIMLFQTLPYIAQKE